MTAPAPVRFRPGTKGWRYVGTSRQPYQARGRHRSPQLAFPAASGDRAFRRGHRCFHAQCFSFYRWRRPRRTREHEQTEGRF